MPVSYTHLHLKNIRVVSNDRTVIYDLGYDDITPPVSYTHLGQTLPPAGAATRDNQETPFPAPGGWQSDSDSR